MRQPPRRAAQAARASCGVAGRAAPPLLDETRSPRFKSVAEREPSNPAPRVELGNLYFDAERYDDAIKWYGEALKLEPNDVNVSTDLGVSYYYTESAGQGARAVRPLARRSIPSTPRRC